MNKFKLYQLFILVIFILCLNCSKKNDEFYEKINLAWESRDTSNFKKIINEMNDTTLSDTDFLHTRLHIILDLTHFPVGLWDSNCDSLNPCFSRHSIQYRKKYRETIKDIYISYCNSKYLFKGFNQNLYNNMIDIQDMYFDQVQENKISSDKYIELIIERDR